VSVGVERSHPARVSGLTLTLQDAQLSGENATNFTPIYFVSISLRRASRYAGTDATSETECQLCFGSYRLTITKVKFAFHVTSAVDGGNKDDLVDPQAIMVPCVAVL
jgi:hypothetical protein